MISTPLTVLTVAAIAGLVGLLMAGVSYVALTEEQSTRAGARVLGLGGGVVLGWAALVLVLAAGGSFEVGADTTVPALAFAIALPVILGVSLLAAHPFRSRLERLPVHWLIGVQFYRVAGALFLIAYVDDRIPGVFALPAGIGDVLVGVAAPIVAYSLATKGMSTARRAALGWNLLGIADLVMAVTLGVLSSPSTFQQLALETPNEAIAHYPFVLIPTFAVPVSLLLHIFALDRLRLRPPAARGSRAQPARQS